jgi:hypothetical protein
MKPGDPCRPQAQAMHVIDVLSDLFILRGAVAAPPSTVMNSRHPSQTWEVPPSGIAD